MAILPKRVVQELSAYSAPDEGRLDYIRLDFCENTQGFPSNYPGEMPADQISAYPEYGRLIQRLATVFGIESKNLLLTNGSDEGIFLIAHTFIEPGAESAVVSKPCFSVVPHNLKLAGAQVFEVPVMKDFSFDVNGIEKVLQQGVKIAMFATPENPTGATLAPNVVREWCIRFPETLFAIDEAYIDYAEGLTSLLEDATKLENLLVLRTFSKAWGMAGLRLGMIVGSPQLLEYIRRVRSPYSVNTAAVWTCLKMIENVQRVSDASAETRSQKNILVRELRDRNFSVVDGSSNALLLFMGEEAQRLTDYCRTNGLLVRNRSTNSLQNDGSPLWGMVRVSAGTPEENKKFLELLDSFITNPEPGSAGGSPASKKIPSKV